MGNKKKRNQMCICNDDPLLSQCSHIILRVDRKNMSSINKSSSFDDLACCYVRQCIVMWCVCLVSNNTMNYKSLTLLNTFERKKCKRNRKTIQKNVF